MRVLATFALLTLVATTWAGTVQTIKIDPEPVPCNGEETEFKYVNTTRSPLHVKQVQLWQRVSGPARGFADVLRVSATERQIILFGRWLYPSNEYPVFVNFAPDSVPVAPGDSLVLFQGCREIPPGAGAVVQSVAVIWYTETP